MEDRFWSSSVHVFVQSDGIICFVFFLYFLFVVSDNAIWNSMLSSATKNHLEPNTERFKRIIYYDTDTQYAHFWRNPLHRATKCT